MSRLAAQKGFDLLFDALPQLLAARDLRVVVLGSGEARFEQFFERLARSFPRKVCFSNGYNNELAHSSRPAPTCSSCRRATSRAA